MVQVQASVQRSLLADLHTQLYTLRQAGAELGGIDEKTVLRHCQRLQIVKQRDPRDQRRWVLTEDQLTRLRNAYPQRRGAHNEHSLDAATDAHPNNGKLSEQGDTEKALRDLSERIGLLETRVAELHSALASVSLSLAKATDTVSLLAQRLLSQEREYALSVAPQVRRGDGDRAAQSSTKASLSNGTRASATKPQGDG